MGNDAGAEASQDGVTEGEKEERKDGEKHLMWAGRKGGGWSSEG